MKTMSATSTMPNLLRTALVALAVGGSAAPLWAQAADVAQASKVSPPAPLPRRGFNVVLLVGDMTGPGYPKPIPEAAMRALADMRDFLPYKGYNLLDTQWIVGGTSSPAITRLRGLDDQEYELELRVQQTLVPATGTPNPASISMRFVLRDVDTGSGSSESGRTALHPKELAKADPAADIAREIFQLERERTDLEITIEKDRRQVEIGTKDPVEVRRPVAQLQAVNKRINELKQSLNTANAKAAGRTVIDTSFRMDDGETVVVGTSKVKGGGKALIALLTATSDRPRGSTK
jgi:hypothetical protein